MKSKLPDNSIIKRNILLILEEKKISRATFYRITGITRGVLNQNNGLNEENIQRAINYFHHIEPLWLLTGRGLKERPLSRTSSSKVEGSSSIDEELIPLIPTNLLSDYFKNGKPPMGSPLEWYHIPLLSGANFLITMRSSGMSPVYNSGDLLICRMLSDFKFILWNSAYVLDTDYGIFIKRIRRGEEDDYLLLVSDEDGYEPVKILRSEVRHLAIVVGVLRID